MTTGWAQDNEENDDNANDDTCVHDNEGNACAHGEAYDYDVEDVDYIGEDAYVRDRRHS